MVEAIMDVPNKVVQRRKSSIVETIKLKNTHKYKKAMEEILYQISPLKTKFFLFFFSKFSLTAFFF